MIQKYYIKCNPPIDIRPFCRKEKKPTPAQEKLWKELWKMLGVDV